MKESTTSAPAVPIAREEPLQAIRDALQGLRFGSVTAIVQDGVVIQLERIEKRRLGRAPKND